MELDFDDTKNLLTGWDIAIIVLVFLVVLAVGLWVRMDPRVCRPLTIDTKSCYGIGFGVPVWRICISAACIWRLV